MLLKRTLGSFLYFLLGNDIRNVFFFLGLLIVEQIVDSFCYLVHLKHTPPICIILCFPRVVKDNLLFLRCNFMRLCILSCTLDHNDFLLKVIYLVYSLVDL